MSSIDVSELIQTPPVTVSLGSHRGIIQSILDFDYMAGRERPSVVAIIATGRRSERYFFGQREVLIPVYSDIDHLPAALKPRINLFMNVLSGRRVKVSSVQAMEKLPNLVGGVVFAEGLPERHALDLAAESAHRQIWVIGGASVGIVIPGVLKLGAIGGVQAAQLDLSRLFTPGNVAVVSSSGGMVNEIIRTVATSGHAISFALAVGGERFPMLTPSEAFLAAEADPHTKAIVYFGELGGRDEYDLIDLIKARKVTKPVIAYIAGTVADLFETPPQFGHAKAMAATTDQSATAKREALRRAGVDTADSFEDFVAAIAKLPDSTAPDPNPRLADLVGRRRGLMVSSISGDGPNGDVQLLGQDLLKFTENSSFAKIAMSMLLGRPIKSKQLEEFTDFVLRLLVDHGPYVSGSVNTIVSARAGKDLISSLVSGLLTIGPRFGGAINAAAATWLNAVGENIPPAELVETKASQKQYISGIGHRKYRSDLPDPRVKALLQFGEGLKQAHHTKFALGVEAETTRKKGNLILNVDGAIAAVMLDLLSESEGLGQDELTALVSTEFFNALFVLSRSVGFMAHYFDQVRLDEGIFRLRPDQVSLIEPNEEA